MQEQRTSHILQLWEDGKEEKGVNGREGGVGRGRDIWGFLSET